MGQTRINHMLFIDDLKLFGKSERQIELLVNTVHAVSDDTGMEFGIKKCGLLIMKTGKAMTCEGIELANGMTMKEVESEGYRYLRILELNKVKDKEMKEQFQKEYMRRLNSVLKSKLNRRNKILAVNTWAVSALRYGAGIPKWKEDDIAKSDRRTRKMMTMFGALHPKSNGNSIYLPRARVGRGLISCERCIRGEENNMEWYVRNSIEPLLEAVKSAGMVDVMNCVKPGEFKKNVWKMERNTGGKRRCMNDS